MSAHRSAAAARPIEQRLLLTVTLCLMAAGAVMVYSASSARTLLEGDGDGSGYLVKYIAYGSIGLVLMQALSRCGLETIRRLTPLLVLVAFGLLIAVRVPGLGVEVNGARRWIGAGALQFQPSEAMKLALVLYAARLIATDPGRIRTLRGMASPLLLVAGLVCAMVATQPDLGTAIVIAMTVGALLIAGGVALRNIALVSASASRWWRSSRCSSPTGARG